MSVLLVVAHPDDEYYCAATIVPVFSFDRRPKFGFKGMLDYAVLVHWMMAEHTSQGLFQTAYGVDDLEDRAPFD